MPPGYINQEKHSLDEFSVTFEKQVEPGFIPYSGSLSLSQTMSDIYENMFKVTDASGDYDAVDYIQISNRRVSLSVIMRISEYGDTWGEFVSNANVVYYERKYDDTADRRTALAEVFRVLVNGELVGGELWRSAGNGHQDYYFVFDSQLPLDEVQTISIEVGRLRNEPA
jgi:hypothetical protein